MPLDVKAGIEESSEALHQDLRAEIDALATRHELADGSADTLQGLVRFADWRQPNFVPKADPDRRMQSEKQRSSERQRRVALRMLAESLAGLEVEQVRRAGRLADIGSGAGFPGLVLGIALPQARVALLEMVNEKCGFLRRTVAELGLDNVEVVEGTVQQWSDGVGTCDVVTSRRAGRPNTIVEWSAPLLAPGGAIVLWQQGRRNPSKEALAADAADGAGLRLAEIHSPENRNGIRIKSHLYVYVKVDES